MHGVVHQEVWRATARVDGVDGAFVDVGDERRRGRARRHGQARHDESCKNRVSHCGSSGATGDYNRMANASATAIHAPNPTRAQAGCGSTRANGSCTSENRNVRSPSSVTRVVASRYRASNFEHPAQLEVKSAMKRSDRESGDAEAGTAVAGSDQGGPRGCGGCLTAVPAADRSGSDFSCRLAGWIQTIGIPPAPARSGIAVDSSSDGARIREFATPRESRPIEFDRLLWNLKAAKVA